MKNHFSGNAGNAKYTFRPAEITTQLKHNRQM